jgi:hypothetical protein
VECGTRAIARRVTMRETCDVVRRVRLDPRGSDPEGQV